MQKQSHKKQELPKAKKWFGQNFLSDINYVLGLIDSAHITDSDTVIEIGPGRGDVTELLLQTAKEVVSIEVDDELIPFLREKFAAYYNFELIHSDILEINLDQPLSKYKSFKIIGSLPYNISKKIIKLLLETNHKPEIMSFIIQKEVAQKYTASAPKSSFLSNYAQILSEVEYIAKVPRDLFDPIPKVDGAIITFMPKADIDPSEARKLINFIKKGFSSPRKKLSKNLANYSYDKITIEKRLVKLGLKNTARAGELTLQQWQDLYDYLTS